MFKKKGCKVPATSIDKIRRGANYIRLVLNLGKSKVDMITLIEFVLPQYLPNFVYEIIEKHLMKNEEARTYPDQSLIHIREDIYQNATTGCRRAQFTLAHELGHLVMHSGLKNSIYFSRTSSKHEFYEDSEWQADTFAAEFLMPHDKAMKCKNVHEIMEVFGVSFSAATKRYNKIH